MSHVSEFAIVAIMTGSSLLDAHECFALCANCESSNSSIGRCMFVTKEVHETA